MPPTKPKTVHEALLSAQQALEGIDKNGRNEFHNYDYVTAESMISECRAVLHQAGLILTAGDVELIPCAEDTMIVRATHTIALGGAESVSIVRDWPAVLSKGRPMDKAVAGALTAGLSYTLRDLLLIPRGDEDGVGLNDTKRSAQEAKSPPRRTKSTPAKKSSAAPANGVVDATFSRGDRVRTSKGNVGSIFWIGGEKGDRVGVSWGESDDEKEWSYVRFLTAVDEPAEEPPTQEAPPYDDSEIPF